MRYPAVLLTATLHFMVSFCAFNQGLIKKDLPLIMKAVYNDRIYPVTDLVKGPDYFYYPVKVYENAHPFFLRRGYFDGRVLYDKKSFSNLHLSYDIVLDELIMQHADRQANMVLLKDWVSDFWLEDRHFIYIKDRKELSNGYYEQARDGVHSVILKHSKKYEPKRVIDNEVYGLITLEKDQWYILLNGKYEPVKTIKGLLKLLPKEDARKVKHWLRKEGLEFKTRPVETLVAVSIFLDREN